MLISVLKKLQKLKQEKKGSTAIEIVIGVLFFVILIAVIADMLIIAFQWQTVSQLNSYVARTSGIQGGVLTGTPTGYPGGSAAYITLGEMNNVIDKKFNEIGISKADYSVIVNGKNISNGGSTGEIDYGIEFDTRIEFNYTWKILSSMIPGDVKQKLSSTRTTISEFKYRYDSWVGE